MDFSNTKNWRMRVDYQYATTLTIDDFKALLGYLEYEETYFIPPDEYYVIEKINSLMIYTASNPAGGVEITVYMNVDLGRRIE